MARKASPRRESEGVFSEAPAPAPAQPWTPLLGDGAAGVEVVAEVLDDVVRRGSAVLYDRYLAEREVPYAVTRIMDDMFDVVDRAFLRHDVEPAMTAPALDAVAGSQRSLAAPAAGLTRAQARAHARRAADRAASRAPEHASVPVPDAFVTGPDTGAWACEPEPVPAPIDSWARGAVPTRKRPPASTASVGPDGSELASVNGRSIEGSVVGAGGAAGVRRSRGASVEDAAAGRGARPTVRRAAPVAGASSHSATSSVVRGRGAGAPAGGTGGLAAAGAASSASAGVSAPGLSGTALGSPLLPEEEREALFIKRELAIPDRPSSSVEGARGSRPDPVNTREESIREAALARLRAEREQENARKKREEEEAKAEAELSAQLSRDIKGRRFTTDEAGRVIVLRAAPGASASVFADADPGVRVVRPRAHRAHPPTGGSDADGGADAELTRLQAGAAGDAAGPYAGDGDGGDDVEEDEEEGDDAVGSGGGAGGSSPGGRRSPGRGLYPVVDATAELLPGRARHQRQREAGGRSPTRRSPTGGGAGAALASGPRVTFSGSVTGRGVDGDGADDGDDEEAEARRLEAEAERDGFFARAAAAQPPLSATMQLAGGVRVRENGVEKSGPTPPRDPRRMRRDDFERRAGIARGSSPSGADGSLEAGGGGSTSSIGGGGVGASGVGAGSTTLSTAGGGGGSTLTPRTRTSPRLGPIGGVDEQSLLEGGRPIADDDDGYGGYGGYDGEGRGRSPGGVGADTDADAAYLDGPVLLATAGSRPRQPRASPGRKPDERVREQTLGRKPKLPRDRLPTQAATRPSGTHMPPPAFPATSRFDARVEPPSPTTSPSLPGASRGRSTSPSAFATGSGSLVGGSVSASSPTSATSPSLPPIAGAVAVSTATTASSGLRVTRAGAGAGGGSVVGGASGAGAGAGAGVGAGARGYRAVAPVGSVGSVGSMSASRVDAAAAATAAGVEGGGSSEIGRRKEWGETYMRNLPGTMDVTDRAKRLLQLP